MAEVKVTLEELATTIADYENKKSAFMQSYLQMSNEVRSMSVNYKGDAAEKFWAKFDEIYKNLSQTEERMDGAIDKLKQVSQVYEATEAAHKQLTSQLETDFAAQGNIFG